MTPARDGPAGERPHAGRKARDRAFALPLVGLFLLLPPLAGIFQLDVRIAGVPFAAVYLFGVWALLIAGAALLSTQLREEGDAREAEDEEAA